MEGEERKIRKGRKEMDEMSGGGKGYKGKMEKGAAIRAGGKVAVVFLLSLLGLGLVTFLLVRMLGLELTYP